MEPKSIEELDNWMEDNCYNTHTYGIGDRIIHEGCGLDKFGSLYIWYYTERGKRQTLKYFQTEKEAVEYAYKIIANDRWASMHLIGFLKDETTEQELISELKSRAVEYWKDEIPYEGPNKPVTRIFVIGCDIEKVKDLKEKYYKEK